MKRLLKKRWILLLGLVLIILCACISPPRIVEPSARHSQAEIHSAMTAAVRHFKSNDEFPRILLLVEYDDSDSLKVEHGNEDTILLHMAFYTTANSGPFNPNSLYTDFQYKMVKRNGEWQFQSAGYC